MDYRSIIESKYNRTNWQKLLYDIFRQNIRFWQQPIEVSVDENMAKTALYIGQISLPDGHGIAVYEVELSDKVIIERNRAGIRNLLCTNWSGMGCAGAFMFCYRQNESVLRFSYVSEALSFTEDGSLKKESTDTKRFTYLLGEGHRSRTAIDQFEKLKKSSLDLKDVTKAFSVEALSDSFFKEYKKQYEDIVEFVTGKRMIKGANNKWKEEVTGEPCAEIMREFAAFPDAEKAVRDYVKKLMGRLVFIQFLQKKGWMGCPAGEAWKNGDSEFVQNLFANTPYKETFVDDVLEPLFNDINTKRPGDLTSSPHVGENIKIPYLNGGLFENDDYDSTNFPLPAKYMKSMLDFFASYNFTIDENDPDDAEIGVDPEMLGRIFENLLEDNKDKGAFYTPKEIVQYMCRESLIAYLQTDISEDAVKDSIRQFVTSYDVSPLDDELKETIDKKLKEVKICDPAIGSGAFPMGLLRELYACRKAIEGIDDETAVGIKTHIIQNNIYGVDIEKGAVDIARLRFWLALIVDEQNPHALPNMDFKIMQGNSLLEQYEGVDLSGMSLNEQLKKKSRSKKQEAWQQTFAFDERIALDNIQHAIHEYYLTDDHATKKNLRSAINENVRSYILNLKGCTSDIQQKLENLPIPNDQFFLWHIYFKDVFDKGGFDIVIGNPPYISLQANDGLLADIYHDKGYLTFNGTGDIYSLFYEQGYRLLKTKGHLCFITSNKWMRNASGMETREFLTSSANPKLIFDFAGVQLFENATVETNILLFSKEENLHHIYAVTTDTKCKTIPCDLQDYAKNNGTVDNFEGAQEWIILSPIEAGIQKKISRCAIPLKDWNLSINFGLKTGYNKAFIIDEEVRKNILEQCHTSEEYRKTNDIIKPILRGRDIKRYELAWSNLWIINTHNGLKKENIAPIDVNELYAIKSHLDQYWDKLKSRQDKGITPYNLRNCAYLNELSLPKIIWGEISDRSKFCLDENGDYLCEATTFFMTGDISIFLLCYLNSSLSEYLFSKIATRTGMGTTRWKKYKIEKLLVPKVPEDIISKVEQLYHSYKRDSNILYLQKIDKLIYDFYGLTDEEIAIIENSTK